MAERKIGTGALKSYFNQGIKELKEATIAFPGQTPIAQDALGMPGNATSQEVTANKELEAKEPELE